MKKLIFYCLLFCSVQSQSQRSWDPEFQKIEDNAYYNFEKKGKYEEANAIYSQLLNHPSLTCMTEGRMHNFIAINHISLSQVDESLKTFLTKTIPIWENCDSLKRYYLVGPYNRVAKRYLVLKRPEKTLQYAHKVIDLYNRDLGKETEYQRLAEAYRYAAAANSMLGNSYLSYKYINAADFVNTNFVNPKYQPSVKFINLQEKLRLQYEDEAYEDALITAELAQNFEINEANGYTPTKSKLFDLHANKLKTLINLKRIGKARKELEYLSENISNISSIDTRTQYYQLSAQYNSLIGNQDSAIDSLSIAVELASTISDMSNRAMNKLNLAQVYHRSGKISLSEEYIAKAIGDLTEMNSLNILSDKIDLMAKTIVNYDDLFFILTAYYEIKIESYHGSVKISYLNDAIAIFDEMDYLVKSSRNTYESEFSQLNHLEKLYGMYEQMIALLVDRNETEYHKLAMKYCMDNKSTVLTNETRKKRNHQIGYTEEDKAIQVKQNRKLFELENEYLTTNENLKDSINLKYLAEITNSYLFNNQLSENYPAKKTDESYSSISIDEIIETLTDNTALLEIYYGKENVYIFRILNGEIKVIKVSLTNENKYFINRVTQYITTEGPLADLNEHSKVVYKNFFSQLINDDSKIEKIIVVADGLFHDLPIETLHDGSGYLIEKYDFQNLYSSQALLDEKQKTNHSYFGFGTKYTDQLNTKLSAKYDLKNIKLSSLPNAETEIKNGADIIGGNSYVGDKSSKASFVQKANSIDGILHFALHGLILDEYTSAILFDDREEDFMLTSSDVYNMEIDNYLSILSACHSADGKIYAGEGVRSLGRAFLAAGSQNIISSLWASSDQANEKIMTSFLTGVKNGDNLPYAFSEAKRQYLKTASPAMQHPSNWGNMVLIGVGENEPAGLPIWVIGISILFLVSVSLFMKKIQNFLMKYIGHK